MRRSQSTTPVRRSRARKIGVGLFLVLFNLVYLVPAIDQALQSPASQDVPDVGIWYSTWYAKDPPFPRTWIAGFGTGSTRQFVADVNLDDVDDAAVFYTGNGSLSVAISNKAGFDPASSWGLGLGVDSTAQFLADVNADRRPDAVFYYHANGTWRVGINNGTGFDPDTSWLSPFGIGSTRQLLGDVDGDGGAHAIAIYNAIGTSWVATSDGTSFLNSTGSPWIRGFGNGSDAQMVEDIDHDGRGDAIAFFGSSGQWRLGKSNGTAFVNPYTWINGHGVGSASQAVATRPDVFKITVYAEAFVFFQGDVNGDGLPGDWYATGKGCINTGLGAGSDTQFFGNVTGDERGWSASIAFYSSNGTWQLQPYRATMRNMHDTWEAWNIKYRPWTLGSYQTYDSGNASVIDEHLAMIADAEIDFLLLDETNNLYVDEGFIFLRAKALASRINVWNSNASHRPIRYALVVGGNQFSHNPATLEYEAGEVWRQFANTTDGGVKNFYYMNGKPLLVNYCARSDEDAWQQWTGAKTNADKFTLRWAHSPAGVNNYGWEIRDGSIPGEEIVLVMPGWNNNKGATPVSRQRGFQYSKLSWEIVLGMPKLPRAVVINSFNEYAEETAVAPADTSLVSGATEQWTNAAGDVDPFMYWDMTTHYINLLGEHGESRARLIVLEAIPFAVASLAVVVVARRKR